MGVIRERGEGGRSIPTPEETLEHVYRTDGARLWRSLVAFSGDRDIASDAVAEAFAQALGRGDALRQPERWVWRAAFRIASGDLKERGRTSPIVDEGASYDADDPPEDLIRALRRLSPNQRAAMILHFHAGYSTREIARILGSSSETVRVHISKGRKRLRAALEADDA
jgi:RNA polymerase sigma-70 factor (ECF subfamily)